jgi:glycogen debranching enzyme
MLGVEHRHGRTAIKKEVDKARFMLSNSGSYLMLSSGEKSRYDGYHVYLDNEMFKIIDNFGMQFSSIKNKLNQVDLKHTKFRLPTKNSLLIETKSPITLNFDIRKSYDQRSWGKNYEISSLGESLAVQYKKTTDHREDHSHNEHEFELTVGIHHNGTHKISSGWHQVDYDYDRKRNSHPFSSHVYKGVTIDATKIAIAVSTQRHEAIETANKLFKKHPIPKIQFNNISKNKEIDMAFNCAKFNLNNLIANNRMFAGLPWFFQFWNRDEAIALGGLIANNDSENTKEMLFKELNIIQPDGRIPNRLPFTQTGSADALGWCLFRIKQLHQQKKLDNTELIFLKAKLQYLFDRFQKHHVKNKLVYNASQETWMDTDFSSDSRPGARIEIQTLHLSIYNMLYELTGENKFRNMEKAMLSEVRALFWNKEILADGLNDFTIRPNIFIAYYIYPNLLSKKDWIRCFDNTLPKLWLDWGGLSTIDKDHQLFKQNHTGENTASYHRGDSWFWINNLVAICMHRLDKKRFKHQIEKILDASTNDILWNGAIGHHAEVSSASTQTSEGCFSQAWSFGTYIELVHELFG